MRPRSFRPRASRICTTHHRKRPRHPSGEACHLSTRITERSRPAAKTTASGPIPRVQPARDTASSRGGGSCNAPVFNGTVFAAPDNRPTAIADRPTRTKEDRRKKNLRPYRPEKASSPTDRKDRASPPVARIKNTAVHCTAVYLLGIWPIASRGDRDTRFFMQPNVGITATPQFAPTLPAPAVFLRKTLRPSMLRRQKGRSSGSSRFTSGAAGVCTGCCD